MRQGEMIQKNMAFNRMQKVGKHEYEATITVEASFVMPIVLYIIIAMIYFAFYLQDRNKLEVVVDNTLHTVSIGMKHPGELVNSKIHYSDIGDRGVFYIWKDNSKEKEEAIKKLVALQLKKGFYLMKAREIQIAVEGSNIKISIIAQGEVTIPFFTQIFKPYSKIIIHRECKIHHPAESIRGMEVILDTASKIKGVAALKEKLEEKFK